MGQVIAFALTQGWDPLAQTGGLELLYRQGVFLHKAGVSAAESDLVLRQS